MTDRVYLVTGAQGFIGAWIIQKLLARKAKVVGFDLKQDGGILSQVLEKPESVRIIFGDISDYKKISEVLEEVKPTHVIHLAGVQVPTCAANPRLGAAVNVIGTVNLFEASKKLREKYPGTVKNIVYASSAAVHGPPSDYKDGVVNDDDVHKPRTQYGVFKLTNEGNARVFWESDKIPSIGIRPLTVYGVGREIGLTSAPTKAIKAALLGLPFEVAFTGSTNFNYVEDVAETFIQASDALKEGALVADIRGTAHTIKEFIDIVHKQIPGSDAKVKLIETTRVIPFPSHYTAKTLDKLIGKSKIVTTPLEKGIAQIIARFKYLQSKGKLDTSDLYDAGPAPAAAPSTPAKSTKQQSDGDVYLITGAQGFIASWIVRKLLEEKKAKAIYGTDLKPDTGILKKVLGADLGKLEMSYGDIADYQHVKQLFEKVRPTHVIHLAALQVPTCRANPPLGARVNVIGTINVFEAVRELKLAGHHVRCIAYASSAGACGPATDYKDGVCHDDSHHVPRSHYGYYKLCNEGNAQVYANDHGIASIGLRPLTVYGVGREIGLTSDPTKAILAAVQGKPFEIQFKGPTNFNYVEDIADLFIASVRRVVEGTYMCGIKGSEATVEEFVAIVKKQLPAAKKLITISEKAPVLPFPYRFSARTLTKLLGEVGEKTTSLEVGISKVIAQFEQLHRQSKL